VHAPDSAPELFSTAFAYVTS